MLRFPLSRKLSIMKINKIFIVCGGGSVTGGPELLHQLGYKLRQMGHDAYMCYYPFDKVFVCPTAYQRYSVPIGKIEDSSENIIIIPEMYTGLVDRYSDSYKMVWWLSVDNYRYQGPVDIFWVRRKMSEIKAALVGRSVLSLNTLRSCVHLVQSRYAADFLKKYGIDSVNLSDYLSGEHFTSINSIVKKPQIAFNPKKGMKTTKLLMGHCPDIKFVAIENLDANGVTKLLKESMIYIDFGYHPGKDRMPREAAMAGCCLITNQRGSAANREDISIPNKYKIDDFSKDFHEKFKNIVDDVFKDFDKATQDFNFYRSSIIDEKSIFESHVESLFRFF